MNDTETKSIYRIQGLSCTNCASKFEKNVKALPKVQDAQINFGASKITVYGEADVTEIEKAGAFDGLRVYPEQEKSVFESVPFWKKKSTINIALSAVFLLMGWLTNDIILYAASIVVGGYSLFIKGLHGLVRLNFSMNTLMTIAVIGAAAIQQWSEAATVVFLFAISEALENFSMEKARQSIRSLMEIAPKEATIRKGKQEYVVSVDDIQIGNIMIVKPGQKIAMDGKVMKGSSSVNQASITGESIPVYKSDGDEVFAGTLNGEGLLEVKVTKRVEDATISKIIHLVEEAQAEKAPSQAFVDRFAHYYTPAIMLIALLTAIIPPVLLNQSWEDWIYRGLALLVVGCPCALVISTPVSIVTAIGNAARNGVLIKGGIHLEQAGQLSVIAFDKTGTLTKGVPVVTDFVSLNGEEKKLLAVAASIEKCSQHPLASAIVRKADDEHVDLSAADNFASITGKGAKAVVNGVLYYIGNPGLFEELNPIEHEIKNQIQRLQEQGKTVMLLGTETQVLALIAVTDEVRQNSKDVIAKLHDVGIQKTVILTGDNRVTGEAIGKQVGIHEVKAELMPQHKLELIKQLKQQGKVAMIGDGVNDAPALASADVGIAMGGAGTDTALETADIALMADDLSKLPFTIKLSRKALQIIKQNITFSLVIKVVALFLIFPGWLTLWMAIFADMGATLIVTLNGLRLLRVKE